MAWISVWILFKTHSVYCFCACSRCEVFSPRFIQTPFSSLPARASRGGRTCPSGFPVSRWKASWTSLSVPLNSASGTVSNGLFTLRYLAFLLFIAKTYLFQVKPSHRFIGRCSDRIAPSCARSVRSLTYTLSSSPPLLGGLATPRPFSSCQSERLVLTKMICGQDAPVSYTCTPWSIYCTTDCWTKI